MRLMFAGAALAALAGCTSGDPSPTQSLNAWALASGNPVGAPVDCVERDAIRGHSARDDRTIDFAMNDGRLLRNRLPFACPGLLTENRFLYRSSTARLCSTDSITVLAPDNRAGANCGLGRFQEVAIPPQPAPRVRG